MDMTRNTKDQTFRGRLRQIFPFSWRDCAVCLGILAAAALLCALLRMIDTSDVYVALIFECAVVLVSRFTDGYLFGLLASVIGVVGVNWIFTYPYMQLNFTISGYYYFHEKPPSTYHVFSNIHKKFMKYIISI